MSANRIMTLGKMVLGFFVVAAAVAGCSWQGTSYDRGGNLHNGSPSDWNTGNGKPATGALPANAPAPESSPRS